MGALMSTCVRSTNNKRLSLTEWLKRWFARPHRNEWEFVVRTGMYVPLGMRRRKSDGTWEYREATEQEIEEYMEAESW